MKPRRPSSCLVKNLLLLHFIPMGEGAQTRKGGKALSSLDLVHVSVDSKRLLFTIFD